MQADRTPDERVPGPKIFFGSDKQIVSGNQSVKFSASTTLDEALVMCLCVYYIRGLSYPAAYGQTLGLLQCLLVENDEFPIQFMSEKLRKLLMAFKKKKTEILSFC